MNNTPIEKVVQAVLYEGYILYPYRRSTKNERRWTFGCLFPRGYSEGSRAAEPWSMQTQCLIRGDAQTRLSIRVRFLQLIDRTVARCKADDLSEFEPVNELKIDGKLYQTWQEAIERSVELPPADLSGRSVTMDFAFPHRRTIETIGMFGDTTVATLVRTQQPIQGTIEFQSVHRRDDVYELTLRVRNVTPIDPSQKPGTGPSAGRIARDVAQMHAMASTHAVFHVTDGAFVSMIDPPPDLIDLARKCEQQGAWPVLVGEAGTTDAVLASPIILYDYPQIAEESPGDLFDGTEIDEILSLRVMTLSDEEKRSAADLDERAAALLKRTEALARDQLMRLHGTMRPPKKVQAVHIGSAELRAGDRVRLRPRGNADAFDIILRGKTATIAAIEQDYENRIHLAVTIDDDPGADIGADGKIGHRFYFHLDEVEPLTQTSQGAAAT